MKLLAAPFLGFVFASLVGGRALCALGADLPSGAEPWDLKRAAKYALDHSPAALTAEENLTIADNQKKNAFSLLLPTFDFESQHGYLWPGSSQTGLATINNGSALNAPVVNNWESSAGFFLKENLYDNGTSWTKYRVSKLNLELQALNRKNARDALLLNLAKAFQKFSLDLKSFQVNEEQYKLLDKQYRSADVQHREGLRTLSDVLRFKIEFQKADIDRLTAHEQIKLSTQEILNVLGIRDQVSLDGIPDQNIFVPLDLERAPRDIPTKVLAEETLPDARVARAQIDISQGDVDIARRARWPELNVTTGGDYATGNYLGPGDSASRGQYSGWSWNVLVNLNYTIWDFGQRTRSERIAASNQRNFDYAWRQKLIDGRRTVSNLMTDLRRLTTLFTETTDLRKTEESNYTFIDSQYRQGRIDYLNLINELRTLLEVKQEYYSTVNDLQQKIAEYRYYEGTIYESLDQF